MPDQAQIAQLTAELAWLRRLTRALLDDARGPDLAHETWLVAAEHAPDDARPLRPWLVRVARNLARMGHRADVRRTRREISTSDDVAPVPTPEALVARAEAQRAVVDAVLALAEPHRSIVLLRYFEELTSNEIAQRLGVPSGTVRRQLKDALDRLRSQLGADREVRKRALAPLLLPLAGARPIPISVGVIAMKKIVAVVVALAVAVVATVWWRRSGSTPPESVATSASSAGNAPRRSAIGSASTAGWFAPHEIGDRSIAGRVVFDDQPVASATVTLIAFTQHRGKLTRELRTDADGHFDFGALSPTDATYEVTASAPGRSPAVVWVHLSDPTVKPAPDQLVLRLGSCERAVFGTVFDASGTGLRGVHVLRDGEVGVDADEHGAYRLCSPRGRGDVEFRLEGYGGVVLSVDVQGETRQDVVLVPEATISGRVISLADGHPIGDALISAAPWRGGTDRPATASTVSDSDGRFHLSGLIPDRYGLIAATDGGKSERLSVHAYVGAGADVELRVVALGRMTGRVVSNGQPVAGASLVATRVSPNARSDAGISQSDGTFVLEHVPLGDVVISAAPYRLVSPTSVHMKRDADILVDVERLATIHGRVTRNGAPVANAVVCCVPQADKTDRVHTDDDGMYQFRGVRAGTHHFVAANEDVGAGSPEAVVTIGDGDDRQVDIDLSLAATISGNVVDQQGTAVAGALVIWTNKATGDIGKATTDRAGHYRCTAMTGGATYRAAVFPGRDQPPYPVANDDSYPELDVRDGSTNLEAEPIAIVVQSLSIAGHVVDDFGSPIADALVKAIAMPPSGSPTFSSWLKLPSTFTDGDGAFALSGLAAGSYAVGAHSPDGGEGSVANVGTGTDSASIRITRPGSITGSLTGFAVAPVVSASDVAHVENSPIADAMDASSFRITGLRPGRYVVSASTEHDGDAQIIDVQNGRASTVALHARGHAALSVTVLDFKTHAPIAGAACHVQPTAGGMAGITNWSSQAITRTDANGQVSLDEVPAGPGLVLCVMPTGMMSIPSADVTLSPDSRGSAQLFTVTSENGYPTTIGVSFDWRSPPPRIASVAAGGPGFQAGMQVGDLITSIDGVSVAGLNGSGVANLIAARVAGAAFQVTVLRGGATLVFALAGQPPVYQ